MNAIIEIERLIYSFNEGRHEDKLMLVKERRDTEIAWKPLAKGWEYQLWYEIGERGGMAEAEEILIMENGEIKKATIEEYVKLYKGILSNMLPIEDIFKRFSIQVEASREKNIDEENSHEKYLIDKIENTYKLKKTKEDNERIYYKKELKNIEELADLPILSNGKDCKIEMIFIEKA